ncbi:MAG: hypothetical protein IJQ39_14430 [Thermoguttaceae bacterium]|nr:hypothetical protein [Thermoguttaceae bacterium]
MKIVSRNYIQIVPSFPIVQCNDMFKNMAKKATFILKFEFDIVRLRLQYYISIGKVR